MTDIETGERASEETLFYTASSTKSMTALAMEILDQRAEINLDETLAAYAPDAKFPAEIGADNIRLRDLLTHTAGIDNRALVIRSAITGQHSPKIDWKLLSTATVKAKSPTGTFAYTNAGYNILTVMTDRKIGKEWQDILQREIFDPAEMSGATARISGAVLAGRSIARPHFGASPDGVTRLLLEKTDATQQSAGGVYMSANDAVRWLELMINDGEVGGVQAVPASVVAAVKRPIANVGSSFAGYTRDAYALGWYVGRYRDEPMIHSFGSFAGTRSHVSFLPGLKTGVAIFVNDGSVGAKYADVIANYIYDTLAKRQDALALYDAGVASLIKARDQMIMGLAEDRKIRAGRKWKMSAPLASYAGRYDSPNFGEMVVEATNDRLRIRFGAAASIAEPFREEQDTVRVEFEPFSGEVIGFRVEPSGIVTGLNYSGERFIRTE